MRKYQMTILAPVRDAPSAPRHTRPPGLRPLHVANREIVAGGAVGMQWPLPDAAGRIVGEIGITVQDLTACTWYFCF